MEDKPGRKSEDQAALEQQIREGRAFTAQEAIARMAGPGAMKGASPVSRERQAEIEIGSWLSRNVGDDPGALKRVLHRQIKGSPQLLDNVDRPLVALAVGCKRILASDELLKELVREADVEWGRAMDERPLFERSGMPPDAGDPYTAENVRRALEEILKNLP